MRVVSFDTDGKEGYILQLADADGDDIGCWYNPNPGDWKAFGRTWSANVVAVTNFHTNETVVKK